MEGTYERFFEEDIQKALNSMKTGKATGTSDILLDLLKLCGRENVQRLMKVANGLLKEEKIPDSWKLSYLIPIYKGKGDVKQWGSHRSTKLLEHGMKVVEIMFEKRLKRVVNINEIQMGFMPGKSTAEAIFSVRTVMDKHELAGKKLYMVFVDLKKHFTE